MKIHIFNESGIGHKTEVTNAETGEKIGRIREAVVRCAVNEIVTVELTFNMPIIDVFGIAKLSDQTKKELRELREILERIDCMEKAQKENA